MKGSPIEQFTSSVASSKNGPYSRSVLQVEGHVDVRPFAAPWPVPSQ